jgi:hypothetical protein
MVAVPKTAVHEDRFAAAGKIEINFARQFSRVQAIAIPHCVKHCAQSEFWSCVGRADRLHDSPPLFGRARIGH